MLIKKTYCKEEWERPLIESMCNKVKGLYICCYNCDSFKVCQKKCALAKNNIDCGFQEEISSFYEKENMHPGLELAIELALKYHANQLDKAGASYVLHPLHLMNSEHCSDNEDRIVAVLHDILEDTILTRDDLIEEGIEEHLVKTLELLSKPLNIDYMEYIRTIKQSGNSRAIRVKLADLEHNADLTRLQTVTERDIARTEQYLKAIEYLKS